MSGYIGNFVRSFFGTNEAAQILTFSTLISDSQVKGLPTTPVTIVPAPGAGLLLWPMFTLLLFKSGSSAYTNISPDGIVFTRYHGSVSNSTEIVNNSRIATDLTGLSDFFGSTGGVISPLIYPFQDDRGAPIDAGMLAYQIASNGNANLALDLVVSNGGLGAFTGGGSTNPITAVTTYLIVSVP